MLPDGRIDLIVLWRAQDALTIRPTDVAIAGPSTTFHTDPGSAGLHVVGLRFRPGEGALVLRRSSRSLLDTVAGGAEALASMPAAASLLEPAMSPDVLVARLRVLARADNSATG